MCRGKDVRRSGEKAKRIAQGFSGLRREVLNLEKNRVLNLVDNLENRGLLVVVGGLNCSVVKARCIHKYWLGISRMSDCAHQKLEAEVVVTSVEPVEAEVQIEFGGKNNK